MKTAAILTDSVNDFTEIINSFISKSYCNNFHLYTDPCSAMEELSRISCDILILDIDLVEVNVMELAARLHKRHPQLQLVLAASTSAYALEAMQMGVFDYFLKPLTSSYFKF